LIASGAAIGGISVRQFRITVEQCEAGVDLPVAAAGGCGCEVLWKIQCHIKITLHD